MSHQHQPSTNNNPENSSFASGNVSEVLPPGHLPPHQHPSQTSASVMGVGTAAGAQPVFDLAKFWQEQVALAEVFQSDFKNHPLPLARIKKVMKTDQDVKMISAEAPILFAKGCEIFITELTKRAWVHAEENKRRTLQRSDIATAISKTDMCDFLIDIVPREEAAKSSSTVYDQNAYANYYQQPSVPQYTSSQPMGPSAYYPQLSQLTPEQMQQYQLQLQQFATQHTYSSNQPPATAHMPPRQVPTGQHASSNTAHSGHASNPEGDKPETQKH